MNEIEEIIKNEITESSRRLGLNADKTNQVASCVTERLRMEYGGSTVYIRAKNLEERNSSIKAEFTGNNIQELSRKYGVSKRSVSRIVNSDGLMNIKNYRKKHIQPMRPYVPGEDMTHISVSESDEPEQGGMIAINPEDINDRRYVAKKFFEDNYIEA